MWGPCERTMYDMRGVVCTEDTALPASIFPRMLLNIGVVTAVEAVDVLGHVPGSARRRPLIFDGPKADELSLQSRFRPPSTASLK